MLFLNYNSYVELLFLAIYKWIVIIYQVLYAYVEQLDFARLEFDDAIRKFLQGFRYRHVHFFSQH
jgi:hypothetical protein